MRRMLGALIAGLVLLCGRSVDAEQVHLTWFMWSGTEPEVVAWKHVAQLVTDKYPDIVVEFQTTSFPEYWTRLTALAAASKLPDIVSLQSLRAPGFVDLMVPLDDRIKAEKFDVDAFDPSIIKGLSRNGKQFALPYDFGPWVLYYNRDMFMKANLSLPAPGWTEADFMRDAKALTGNGVFGFAASIPDAFMVFARSKGAHYLDAAGNLDLTNAGMKSAFAQYAALVNTDKVAPLLPASGVQSSSVANGRFTSGNVAMYVDGPWQILNIKKKANFSVGMAPVPAREAGSITLSAGSGFGIATTSSRKDEAWKAIQVMTGPDAEKYLAEAGRAFAARKEFQKYWYEVAADGVVGAREALPAALKSAEPYVTTPNWATVAALFEQYAPLAFGGADQPGKTLETIQNLANQ